MNDDAKLTGKVVHLVERALRIDQNQSDLVAAAERVLFALRVTLEDAGAQDPLGIIVEALGRDQAAARAASLESGSSASDVAV